MVPGMPAEAAGTYRRTPLERADQRISWERADEAFFASGACHILAWACRDRYPQQAISLAALFPAGQGQPLHVYAIWRTWAFDFSGWNREPELLAANAAFEGYPMERADITVDLAEFCETYTHRRPHQYWRDPLPRARDYLSRHSPPWS
jgi:hypothetical protein